MAGTKNRGQKPNQQGKTNSNNQQQLYNGLNGSSEAISNSKCHKIWPDLQFNQSSLFFECTLFLYSVLALLLQYLNLYKTLWWLPKSHWHHSLKYHIVNPYVLSCIGLLLGLRVTKGFWDTLTQRINFFSKNADGMSLVGWKVLEYSLLKTPLVTIISTSFFFSMSRICGEFGLTAFLFFVFPFCMFLLSFKRAVFGQLKSAALEFYRSFSSLSFQHLTGNERQWDRFIESFERIGASPKILNIEAFTHICGDSATIRKDSLILLADIKLRMKYSIFIGFYMTYFSIGMPRFMIPVKTTGGEVQQMLTNDPWLLQMSFITFLTSVSLCLVFFFPINYLDLLYRYARHLGTWEPQIPEGNYKQQVTGGNIRFQPHNTTNLLSNSAATFGSSMQFNGISYTSRPALGFDVVAAEPGDSNQRKFYNLAKDPIRAVNWMCFLQAFLVATQFWLLLLTTDWQHIVTLVLLMFANYLLLAKVFKDRVLIGRIYTPNSEDLQLIRQIQDDNH